MKDGTEPKEGDTMRFGALVCGTAMFLVVMVGCSSEESAEVTFSARRFGAQPITSVITVSGPAVDRGMICPLIFEYTAPRYETPAGNEIDFSGWGDMFNAAVDAGTVFEVTQYHTWICADGTGTLDATYEVRLDSSDDWSGQLEAGTWRISGGIDAYSGFTGSGYAVVNFDAWDNAGVVTSGVRGLGGWVFRGEITTG